jgi:hypothetical protein
MRGLKIMNASHAALFLSAMLGCAAVAHGDEWPIPRPTAGFGANGHHRVVCDSMQSPQWPGKYVYIFRPSDSTERYPLILFCHGMGPSAPAPYAPFLVNLASRGHVVIFSPYKTLTGDPRLRRRYRILMSGFETAQERYSRFIDTTRVGVVGHSYGGGAVPAVAWHALVENLWGTRGTFMYIMAPWYSYFISQEELESFPSHVALLVEVFHDDRINDRRMAVDLFDNILLPDGRKAFVELYGDSIPGCVLSADHAVPADPAQKKGSENALDFYGVYKFADALADWTFRGDTAARAIAFDTGTAAQRFMGTWPDGRPVRQCTVTRFPDTAAPTMCRYVWENPLNPRRDDSPTFLPETRANRFHYARKTVRSYWEYEKARIRENRAHRNSASDSSLCAIPPIEQGFGSLGPWQMKVDSLPQPLWQGHWVHVFSPEGAPTPRPVILFCHGYSSSDPEHYLPLITHIVSKGYVVVFSPYQFVAMDPREVKKYATIETGFATAIANFKSIIDTSRMGFVGHSFGAGSIPAVSLWALADKNWGSKAAFVYMMAPWYSFEVDRIKLRLFPQRVKMVIEVFADDRVCDHRMAVSLFNTIGIPASEKNFITLYSDSLSGCRLRADHNTPKGPFDPRAEEDALDYYGVYRLFDALSSYAFDGDTLGKALALGRDGAARFMGKWRNGKPVAPLVATGSPKPDEPEDYYVFGWHSRLNPLVNEILVDK